MKDYLLVFTENVDEYNMKKQLRFYPESDIYRYNLTENYDTIIEAAYEAKMKGYDSFHVISMSEDWAEMDFDIKKEIRVFKEVGVIKANYGFKRFKEADAQPTQVKPIATVFPYNLIPFTGDAADLSLETSIADYLTTHNKGVPAVTFYVNTNMQNKGVSIQSAIQAYLAAKNGGESSVFKIPKKFNADGVPTGLNDVIVIQTLDLLPNYLNKYEIISNISTAGTAETPGVSSSIAQGNIVSPQAISEINQNINALINAKTKESLAGKVANDFDATVKDFQEHSAGGNIVINYINNFVFNNLVNNGTIDIMNINIGEINTTIVGDAVAQALGWESSMELHKDTPYAGFQSLLGTAANMITNNGNYNGEMEKSAMKATSTAAANAKTSLGRNAWQNANEYFSNQNDNRERKQMAVQNTMKANLALDKEYKEFDIKIKEIEKQISKLESEKPSPDNEKLLANLKKKKAEYEDLQNSRIANRKEIVNNTVRKDQTKAADTLAGEKADGNKAKEIKSETSYKNLLKKVLNEVKADPNTVLGPIQSNTTLTKAEFLKQKQ